jgi:hypothetical protein
VAALRERVRTRLLPALLTAAGVTLVAAGLLSYSGPVDAGFPSGPPTHVALSPAPTVGPTGTRVASGSVAPSASASLPADRVATRVVIPALKVDLPIVRPPSGTAYPLCDVAEYIQELGQPGQGRATYLYAHARAGMFLPLLRTADQKLLSMVVQVYTSDNMVFLYEITQVRRHQLNLDDAQAATTEQLWLQTSEGPRGTKEKTQVVAMPLSSGPADAKDAHPTPKPVVCG